MSRESIRERAEELGYTYNCRGCGQKSDTPWCGCAAGAPEDPEPEPIDPERLKVIEGLRQLADLVEENPEMAVPYEGSASPILFMCHNKETFAATVKAFGAGEKVDGGETMDFIPEFVLPCTVFGFKRSICKQVTVMRTVPEVRIPARWAEPERIIPAHEEAVTEYFCEPFLAVKDAAIAKAEEHR